MPRAHPSRGSIPAHGPSILMALGGHSCPRYSSAEGPFLLRAQLCRGALGAHPCQRPIPAQGPTISRGYRGQWLLFTFYVLRFLWKHKIKPIFSISFSWNYFTILFFHLRLRSVPHVTFSFTLFSFTIFYVILCLRLFTFFLFCLFHVFVYETECKRKIDFFYVYVLLRKRKTQILKM